METQALADSQAQLVALEMSRRDAITRADWATVANLLADEFHYAHINGLVEDRAAYLKRMDNEPRLITFTAATELHVRLRKGYALMTGKSAIETRTLAIATLFLAVWEDSPHGWKLSAYASTPLPVASASS